MRYVRLLRIRVASLEAASLSYSAGADPKPRLSLLRSVTVGRNKQQPRQQVSVPIAMCHDR